MSKFTEFPQSESVMRVMLRALWKGIPLKVMYSFPSLISCLTDIAAISLTFKRWLPQDGSANKKNMHIIRI